MKFKLHKHQPADKTYSDTKKGFLKVRLHTAINQADFVSWCMLYTYKGNKMYSWENDDVLSWVNH